MILYLDTSALVKTYIDEEGTDLVRAAVTKASVVGTCEIAYVELRAALARRQREGALNRARYRGILRDVELDWPQFLRIAVGNQLVHDAGKIAEHYRLRAYDALHLASSLTLQTSAQKPVTFACWDAALSIAAAKAKLHTLTQDRPSEA